MKITQIKTDKKNKQHLKLLTMDELMQAVLTDTRNDDVMLLRDFVSMADEFMRYKNMRRLPVICPAAEMKKDAAGNITPAVFNGCLLLTVGPLREQEEADAVKRMAAMLPMTMAALTGSSGRTVKVIVRVSRPDGMLPPTVDDAERLLQQACPIVCRLYATALRMVPTGDRLSVAPALREGDSRLLHAGFRMTHDPQPFFCPQATPLYVADGVAVQDVPPFPSLADPQQPADSQDRSDAALRSAAIGQETRDLIRLLESRYAFRMNTVMGYVECRSKEQWHHGWQPVDERMQNGMAMEARLAGLNVWDKDVNRYLKSNMVRTYDPVDEYLWQLRGKWDGRDHIGRLARTVPTDNPHWPRWFRTWLLGMVAQWMGKNRRYGNALAPLLISRQGYNKSTFCKSLIPAELQWGYNDNLLLTEKKAVLQAMSQFLLINLDEFNQISPKVQEGFLKNLIQLASVKVKRPYGKHVEEQPRLASFIATANVTDLLADPSGNRRFIGIELTGPIDTTYRINHEQLYAQAVTLLEQGEPYWLDEEQTRMVMESNRQFQLRSPEELFFNECFAVAPADSTAGSDAPLNAQWLTAAAIFHRVKSRAGSAIRGGNVRAFGRYLANLEGLSHRRTRFGMEYRVVPLPQE